MKRRGGSPFAAALCVVGALAATPSNADIVVLVNGTRMDVKSYEIRDNIVVVTTWDDKVQSFPRAWIDLEQTKAVSRRYDPEDGLDSGQLAKSRALLQAYGVRDAVSGLYEELEVEIRSFQSRIPRTTYDVLRASFRSAFDGERLFDVTAAEFTKNADDQLMDRWQRWLDQPSTQKILAMEKNADEDDGGIEKARYTAEINATPAGRERRKMIERLDRAMHASETGVEMVTTLVMTLQNGARMTIESPPRMSSEEEVRSRVSRSVRKAIHDSMLYGYRAASHDELTRYLAFWESRDGARIAGLSMDAILASIEYGSEMVTHNLRAAMKPSSN